MTRVLPLSAVLVAFIAVPPVGAAEMLKPFVNSLGMKMAVIPAGKFQMGQHLGGEFDERPAHEVTISRPFSLSATEVTNAQFEPFEPTHKTLRGKRGLSKEDDEAVVFVSWDEAVAFCRWLSRKEGKPYRLPTEAEWEYACRAGTTTAYHTGDQLPAEYHKNQKFQWSPVPVSLAVGKTPPNPFGLYDMHGNVEEWCLDWYGSYESAAQTDPVGRESGEMKVARGGSHNTDLVFLRSTNRSGSLPGDKSWMIGFRVVCGELPRTTPMPVSRRPIWARDVKQIRVDWPQRIDMSKPYFGPICTREGGLIQPCDATRRGSGGTAIHVSRDGGRTWADPGADTPTPSYAAGKSGGSIAGIHAGVVELSDNRLMAFGRGDNIRAQVGPENNMGDRMPMSISNDLGKTWTYSASPFPPINNGQRLVLVRLREGPLLFCSFTDPSTAKIRQGMEITDASGRKRTVFGLFAAVSEDDGKTWPYRRLVSDDGPGAMLDGGAWTRSFTMDISHGEPKGYLCLTQTPDGMIHLLSSALHYRFSLAWLKALPPGIPDG